MPRTITGLFAGIAKATAGSEDFRPICDKCNKPVDEITRHALDPASGYITFTVRCHGEEEITKLPAKLIMEADTITAGRAFIQNPQITEGHTHGAQEETDR